MSGFGRSALLFLRAGFPQKVRRAWPYMLVATVLFVAPLFGMIFTIFAAPEWVYSVMPAEQASSLEAMYDPNARHLGRERQSDSDFAMFGFYIMNNISITFQLFASGLVFGLGQAAAQTWHWGKCLTTPLVQPPQHTSTHTLA